MKNLPVEMLNERVHLRSRQTIGGWYHLANEDEIDLTKAFKIHDAFHPDDETRTVTHILFWYPCSDGVNRLMCLPEEPEPELTAEDYAEWCAASCGMTYNAYIGKPWLD